jgi:hypothetical protein
VRGWERAAAATSGLFARGVDAAAGRSARVWIESGLACLAAVLAATTLLFRDWIEIVFRVDPDRGSADG